MTNRDLRVMMWSLMLAMLCVIATTLTGCASSTRRKTITAALVSVDSARDGLLVFDRDYQQRIIDNSTSRDQAVAALDRYYKARAPVVKGLEYAYRALAIAATQADEPSLAAALKAVADAIGWYQKLVSAPPVSAVSAPSTWMATSDLLVNKENVHVVR